MSFKIENFVNIFIYMEFFVVIALLLFTYFLHFYYLLRKRLDQRIERKIHAVFVEMEKRKELPLEIGKKHIPMLVNTFLAWDAEHLDSEFWNQNKTLLMKEKILPVVIQYINHHHWSKRFWLLRCFDYYVDENYEAMIIRLINDKFSIISISATHIAVALGSRPVLDSLLDRIFLETGHFQVLYITQLKASETLYVLLDEKLKSSEDTHVRESCYRILVHIGVKPSFYEVALNDIDSGDLELKLAAIRVLPAADSKAATPVLIDLLEDANWIVRNTAIKSMQNLEKDKIIYSIKKACHDHAWWVRVNAAKILSKFGEESQSTSEKLSTAELASFQEPQYFLKMRDIKGRDVNVD